MQWKQGKFQFATLKAALPTLNVLPIRLDIKFFYRPLVPQIQHPKRKCLQQNLFDMTMVIIMFDTKSSESESFKCRGVYDECPSYDACFVD